MSKKKAAEESIVDAEFDASAEEAPDDPAIFGSGSAEMTILPPGVLPPPAALEADLGDPNIVDHLAPVRDEARACYQVYHDTLQGLPVMEWEFLSAAQQASWLAVAQRSLASKEAQP